MGQNAPASPIHTSSILQLLRLYYNNIGPLNISVELDLQPFLGRESYRQPTDNWNSTGFEDVLQLILIKKAHKLGIPSSQLPRLQLSRFSNACTYGHAKIAHLNPDYILDSSSDTLPNYRKFPLEANYEALTQGFHTGFIFQVPHAVSQPPRVLFPRRQRNHQPYVHFLYYPYISTTMGPRLEQRIS
ncbi:hypothetical protein NP233_g876 [Leucocoprinus birnbaumii]|uniref:Uncharacterized protein n=1 Tax=Leucocoprinus birnbaumii TaxID=56174 RepID=A0AAD5YWD2_9AGAR|nr:hypothetical protein NP233_g876 [Leucocoprinus birnbaumii]